jgi:transcriptional regulator with XRE-family HTH domain
MAIKELSQYITLAQSDKSNSLTLSNTDLLPVSHPRSTRNHAMTASALMEARARWVADDPRIVDGYAKTIIASALTSKYASVEHVYYNSILSSLPQGVVPAEVIVAASNPFSGGNSSAERSLRARLQRRDREGKFAFMGGGLSALVRKSNGRVYNLVGRPIIDGPNGDDIQMELPDGKIVNIPASKGMFIKAVINPTPDGYSKDTAKTATTKSIINEEDLSYVDAPQGWKKTGPNTWISEDGWSIEKGRDKNGFFQYEIKDPSGKTAGTSSGNWEDALDSIAEKKEGKKAVLPSDNKNNIVPKKAPVDIGGNGEGPKPPKPFEFKYPEGAVKIKIDEIYEPEGRNEEESSDYTDDPVEIGQKFDPRDLVQALEQGAIPQNKGENAIGYGVLRFNGGDEFVPVQAIYNALDEAGEDAALELARIYDKALGGNGNENALKDNRKGIARLDQSKPDVAESFERTIAMNPDEVPATELPKFSEAEMNESSLPPVLEGLSDAEKTQLMETGDHTPYLPENESIDMPEGYNTLDPAPFSSWREVTADTPDAVLPEGFSDNPVFIAKSVGKDKLETELRRSIEPDSATPGYANISLEDEDGEEFVANVPGEAVRDALQLQGVDTNALIKSIADEGFAGQEDQIIMDPPKDGKKKDWVQQEPVFKRDKNGNWVEQEPIFKREEIIMDPPKDAPEQGDKFIKNENNGYMEYDLGNRYVVSYGKDEDGNWFAEMNRFSRDGGVDSENSFPAESEADARAMAEGLIDRYNDAQEWEASDQIIMDPPKDAPAGGGNGGGPSDLGKKIYERRIATGESLDEVAKDLGLTRLEVRRLESQYARSLESKKSTSDFTNLTPDQLDRVKSILGNDKVGEQGGFAFMRDSSGGVEVYKGGFEPGDKPVATILEDGGIDWPTEADYDANAESLQKALETPSKDGGQNIKDVDKALDFLDKHMDDMGTTEDAAMGISQAQDHLKEAKKDLEAGDIKSAISSLEDAFNLMDGLESPGEGVFPNGENSAEAVDVVNKLITRLEEIDAPKGLDKPENKEAIAAFNRQYVKDLLDQEEARADELQAEGEGMPRGDAQGIAEAEMKRMYGKTAGEALDELPRDEALRVLKERQDEFDKGVVPDISEPPAQSDYVFAVDVNSPTLQEDIQSAIDKGQKIAFSYNGKERVVLPKSIWTNPKNGNVNLRAIEDGTDGGLKVFTLDKMEMAKGAMPSPNAPLVKPEVDDEGNVETLPSDGEIDGKAMGREAFEKGEVMAPFYNKPFMDSIKDKSTDERLRLLRDYVEGFSRANAEAPVESLPNAPKEVDDEALLDRRLAGESLDVVAEDLGISREEVRRREMNALRKRREANPDLPPAPPIEENVQAPKKELPQNEKVKFSQLNEEEQMEILRDNARVEELADNMAGIKAGNVKVGDFVYHRQLNRWEKVVRIEQGKEKGLDRVIFYVYNPIVGEEQPRPYQRISPLEFVRRIDGGGMGERFPVGKARGRGRRKDIRVKEDPLERVKIREGRVAPAIDKEKNRGLFKDRNGQPILKGDVVIHADPEKAKKLGRGIVKRRVGDQVDEGKKVGGLGRDGKVRLDYVRVQWENEDAENAINNDGDRLIVAKNLLPYDGNITGLVEKLEEKPWKGGVARPNGRNGKAAPAPANPAAPAEPNVRPGMPENIYNAKFRDKNGGNFEINLIKIDDVYEGALIDRNVAEDPQDARVQIVVRDKDKKVAMDALANAREIIKGAANGQEALPDIPNLDGTFLGDENSKPARVPEQGKLLDTPEGKPAAPAPVGPGMPKAIYKAEVEDEKGNKFKISVVKIDDVYEAAVFNENGDLNAVIAKNISLAEVQGVVGRFIGDVAESNDGDKVIRLYGGLPEPVEQPVLTGEAVDVPPLPAVKAIDLKEAKARAAALAEILKERELPGDARKNLTLEEQERMKQYIRAYLITGGAAVDRRQNAKFNDDLRVARRYAMALGWFDEAREIAAIQKRVDKLPLRPMDAEFNGNIEKMQELQSIVAGLELDLARPLGFEGRRKINDLMEDIDKVIMNPDLHNPDFRNGILRGRRNIDKIMNDLEAAKTFLQGRNRDTAQVEEVIEKAKEFKKYFDNFGDMPKLPERSLEGADDKTKALAKVADQIKGMNLDDLRNGFGDWKFEKELSSGINKVLLFRNPLNGERVVIKHDDDYLKRGGGQVKYYGNGARAEDIVAALYRDLGFAQPAFVAANPGDVDPDIGGVGVMEYVGDGFFGLANIDVHNRAGIRDISQVAPEHRAELLDFLVANAIIGNSDRHGENFMWGLDPASGEARLVPIDNGLAIFNGGFNEAEENINNPLHLDPYKILQGKAGQRNGNRNHAGRFGKQWVREIGEDAAKIQIVEFATRMRERAEALKFVDPRANAYLMARADYIINDPQGLIDILKGFW